MPTLAARPADVKETRYSLRGSCYGATQRHDARRDCVLARSPECTCTSLGQPQVTLPTDRQMVMPGDNAEVTCELVHAMAIEEGMRFAFREGGKTVGAGVVSKILD